MIRWSSLIRFLGPRWITRDYVTRHGQTTETNSRVLYALGLVLGARLERVKKGIKARFPGGGAPEDALSEIGRDLKVVRGPDESRASYEVRLQRAIDDWRVAGTAWSILEQVRGYCSPHEVVCKLVNNHGVVYTLEADGSRSRERDATWDWDGLGVDGRARFWVIIYPTAAGLPWAQGPTIGDPALWGGEVGTPGYTVGTTATPGDVQAIRRIIQTWKCPGRCVSVIIAFDDTKFVPGVDITADSGDWGIAHIHPGYAPSREATARYWAGTSIGSGL